jgi:IS30 family transposase
MAYTNHSTTKRKQFIHLTASTRGKIAALRAEGKSLQAIADAIGYNKSTVSRELKRGTVTQMRTDRKMYEAYFPETAQLKYEQNRKNCGRKFKLNQAVDFIEFAVSKIQNEHWSPDAVCGYAKRNGLFIGVTVCTKTLYNYIDKGLLPVKNIDLADKVRRNPKKKRIRKHKRILGKSIEQRPVEIEQRQEFGHWEIDTVIGKKSNDEALLTLTERKTRKEIILKVLSKTSESINQAIDELKKVYGSRFSRVFKTITADNGSEFAELAANAEEKGTQIYFTHPYTSCERGTNERQNGLIRRFIPKGKAISSIPDATIRYVENWCNQLPRKILGYKTPEECFQEELALLIK